MPECGGNFAGWLTENLHEETRQIHCTDLELNHLQPEKSSINNRRYFCSSFFAWYIFRHYHVNSFEGSRVHNVVLKVRIT